MRKLFSSVLVAAALMAGGLQTANARPDDRTVFDNNSNQSSSAKNFFEQQQRDGS